MDIEYVNIVTEVANTVLRYWSICSSMVRGLDGENSLGGDGVLARLEKPFFQGMLECNINSTYFISI